MDVVWINFLYNPLLPLGIIFSVLGAFAFLLFLRGFLSGALYLFTLNGNDDFLKNARIRVLWAFFLLVFLWSAWQQVLWLAAILTGNPTPAGVPLSIVCLLLLFAAYQLAKFIKKKVPG